VEPPSPACSWVVLIRNTQGGTRCDATTATEQRALSERWTARQSSHGSSNAGSSKRIRTCGARALASAFSGSLARARLPVAAKVLGRADVRRRKPFGGSRLPLETIRETGGAAVVRRRPPDPPVTPPGLRHDSPANRHDRIYEPYAPAGLHQCSMAVSAVVLFSGNGRPPGGPVRRRCRARARERRRRSQCAGRPSELTRLESRTHWR
jgi:hypothetical protein